MRPSPMKSVFLLVVLAASAGLAAATFPPTGLAISTVFFNTTCAHSGCWTITGMMTTGGSSDTLEIRNNVFNTFFLPSATGSDTLSYDFDYMNGGNSAGTGVDWTFQPVNHPCSSAFFDPSQGNTQGVTSCCITNPFVGETDGSANTGGFVNNYRTTVAFQNWVENTADDSVDPAVGLRVCSGAQNAQTIQRIGVNDENNPYDIAFPADPLGFLEGSWATGTGKFVGMPVSPGVTMFEVVDPFNQIFNFRIELDEVELRTKAGQLKGTVGVEHIVDTFLGLSNFRTTGLVVLDTFSIQAAIHLEKTSFFTASTHGVNEYNFLEYVNVRLVAVYEEDSDFSSTDGATGETTEKLIHSDSTLAGHYVQVTFTLGAKYSVPDMGGPGLIPSESVLAGQGTVMEGSTMVHKCVDYEADKVSCSNPNECDTATPTSSENKKYFDYLLGQSCAPQSSMCTSPTEIPDQFVAYNIPLGLDYFPPPSNDLSANVFVSLVINAIDEGVAEANAPNSGDDPLQVKATLAASIPVVAGVVNIFCDGVTGKTDLADVAQVDLVVGSAPSAEELSRLRILEDIQSTSLSGQRPPSQVDSDSIDAGLMTLVIQGDESHFLTNPGRSDVSVELEDVITIHIMESAGGDFADVSTCTAVNTSMMCKVYNLVTEAADDSTGFVDTSGYGLNGAFRFEVDRGNQQAKLEPTDALLSLCPFNPLRPPGGSPLSTCVTRRDVLSRGFPFRSGALSTAIEVCPGGTCHTHSPGTSISDSQPQTQFFTSILGESEYVKDLSVSFANVIKTAYDLNGRYRRAFWINPGYEWTPTQAGGRALFSISQKLFLFAIVTVDEGLTSNRIAEPPNRYSRRRMLLQSTPEEALKEVQSGIGTQMIGFQTSPKSMMARAFSVQEDRVATVDVKLQLTKAEACTSEQQLLGILQATLDDYVRTSSSPLHTVQITRMEVDKADGVCTRRAVRGLKAAHAAAATADVTMLLVFQSGQASEISLAKLATMPGVQTVTPLDVSAQVNTAADDDDQLEPGGGDPSGPPSPTPTPSPGGDPRGCACGAAAQQQFVNCVEALPDPESEDLSAVCDYYKGYAACIPGGCCDAGASEIGGSLQQIQATLQEAYQMNASNLSSNANVSSNAGSCTLECDADCVSFDVDECDAAADNNCDANAACTNTDGSFTCACNAGYTGSDGTECNDADECVVAAGNNCDANAACTNTDGSFTCACNAGYTGSDGTECNDVDECDAAADNNCDANAACTNTDGSFTCACNAGYTGSDGTECNDADECVVAAGNNCDANAACTNTDGSFTCACNAGHTGSDGTACEATITTLAATPQVRMKLELPYTVEQFNDPEVMGGFKRGIATTAGTTADMVEVLSVTAKTVRRRRLLADAVDVDFVIKVASTADAQALQSSDKLSLASLNTALEAENVQPISAIVTAPTVELPPDADSAAPRGVAAAASLSLLAATLTLCRHHFD